MQQYVTMWMKREAFVLSHSRTNSARLHLQEGSTVTLLIETRSGVAVKSRAKQDELLVIE